MLEHTPPAITLLSPLSQTYNDSNVSLAFTVNKEVNWTGYSLDGRQNVTTNGNNSLNSGTLTNFTITKMTNGVHNVTVYANDTYGNIGTSQTINFTVAKPQPFPTATVAAVSVAVAIVVVAGLLVYVKKRKATK